MTNKSRNRDQIICKMSNFKNHNRNITKSLVQLVSVVDWSACLCYEYQLSVVGCVQCSMINERRILMVCKTLGRLTACIHSAAALIYPMHWSVLYLKCFALISCFFVDRCT